jgi:hypothetical protein
VTRSGDNLARVTPHHQEEPADWGRWIINTGRRMLTDSDLVKLDSAASRTRWHLKREVQLGHIITTVTVFMSAIGAYYKMDARITLNEVEMRQQKEFLSAQDSATMASVVQLRTQLDKIEAKLDRLIESRKP